MKTTIAMGMMCAIAVMFAGTATAAESFKDGVTAVTIQHPSHPDPTVHLLVKRGLDKNGDGIFTIQKSRNEKVSLNYSNGKVGWGAPTKWILHKNSSGWSIILESNGALALSIANNDLVLQRNQGAAHQVWQITEK